jgi:hypothetical protein
MLSGASVSPTLQVGESSMLVLLTVENKVCRAGPLEWHNVDTKFRENHTHST